MIYDGIIKLEILLWIEDVFLEIVKHTVAFKKDVHDHQLIRMYRLVVIAIMMQVVSRLEELGYLHAILLWKADLIVVNSHFFDQKLVVE